MLLTLVTHPLKLAALSNVRVLSREAFGPLGLNKYTLSALFPEQVAQARAIKAHPYSFVFHREDVDEDALGMCAQLLEIATGARPVSFDVQAFLDPPVTHAFPLMQAALSVEYLLVCDEERGYIDSFLPNGRVENLLGYKAISADPLCWMDMRIDDALMSEGGGCLIRSEDFISQQTNIAGTLRFAELARRRGFRAEVRQEDPISQGNVARDLSYGPVVFHYNWQLDMQLPLYAVAASEAEAETEADFWTA